MKMSPAITQPTAQKFKKVSRSFIVMTNQILRNNVKHRVIDIKELGSKQDSIEEKVFPCRSLPKQL